MGIHTHNPASAKSFLTSMEACMQSVLTLWQLVFRRRTPYLHLFLQETKQILTNKKLVLIQYYCQIKWIFSFLFFSFFLLCGTFITPAKQIQKLLHGIEMLPYQRKKGKEKENITICGIGFGVG